LINYHTTVETLKKLLGSENVAEKVSMSLHSSFKVGGIAEIIIFPSTTEDIVSSIDTVKRNNIPFTVIGNGSNIVVSDDGYKGVIIKLCKNLNKIEFRNNEVFCQAGALLSTIANKAAQNTLTGMEFAAGIPGTVGGAVAMNAGAYGGEMKNIVKYARCLDNEGNVITLLNSELQFGYRKSIIQKENYIVLDVVISLLSGDKASIINYMDELASKRREKQPLNMPSAGSVFKRPEGHYAGKLIQDCGLRGYSIGGAQISDKHCGFIVNTGTATANDIVNLIKHTQKTVYEKYGVILEQEVKLIGF